MLWTNLDTVVSRRLLELGLPRHYYLEFMLHAATCVRELSYEVLKIVNVVELPVNSYFAIDLPGDFVDDIALSIPCGQYLQPVPKNDNITSLRARNSSGEFVPYNETEDRGEQNLFGFPSGWSCWWNINDWGESTGGWYGAGGGGRANGYKLIKERRQIQLTETFTSDTAVLIYISDGQRADNATNIDVLAWQTIASYIDWKRGQNEAIKDAPEARTFYNERRHLVARLNETTITDIKQIFHKAYRASIKT